MNTNEVIAAAVNATTPGPAVTVEQVAFLLEYEAAERVRLESAPAIPHWALDLVTGAMLHVADANLESQLAEAVRHRDTAARRAAHLFGAACHRDARNASAIASAWAEKVDALYAEITAADAV